MLLICSCSSNNDYFDEKEIIARLTEESFPEIKYKRNNDGELTSIISTYFNNVFNTKITYREINGVEHINYIITYKEDSIRFGHSFKFHINGRLAQYAFNTGHGNQSPYVVKCGYEGIVVQTQGTPLVFHQNNGKKIQIFFSKILYDSLEVQLRTDLSNFEKVKLSNSTVQPGVMETILPITSKDIIFKMRAFRNKEVKEYLDTISITTKH